MNPIFLTMDQVLRIHQDQIDRYGGSHGIRDKALLESAIETPKMTFGGEFVHQDIVEMAAAYLFHICKNHPFIDGNKRVSAVCSWMFLRLNGLEVNPPEAEFEKLVLDVAQGKLDKPAIADFFKQHQSPPS